MIDYKDVENMYYQKFENFILRNKAKPLIWDSLSKSKFIRIEFIIKNIDLPWKWNSICGYNYSITPEIVDVNPTLPWNYDCLSGNVNFPVDVKFIRKNINRFWNWRNLTRHPNITLKDIYDNMDLPWYLKSVFHNPNIDFTLLHKITPNIDWEKLSRNKAITVDIIKANPYLPWSESGLMTNPNINQEIFEMFPNMKWNWVVMSSRVNIDFVIKNNIDMFSMYFLSTSQYIKMNDIMTYELEWDSIALCRNPNITIDFIRDYLIKKGLNISWDYVSINTAINHDDIIDNLDLPWVWNSVINNSSVDIIKIISKVKNNIDIMSNIFWNHYCNIDFVDNFKGPINWLAVSIISREKEMELFIDKFRKEHIAALRLQRYWRYYSSNPIYSLAQRYIERQFNKD